MEPSAATDCDIFIPNLLCLSVKVIWGKRVEEWAGELAVWTCTDLWGRLWWRCGNEAHSLSATLHPPPEWQQTARPDSSLRAVCVCVCVGGVSSVECVRYQCPLSDTRWCRGDRYTCPHSWGLEAQTYRYLFSSLPSLSLPPSLPPSPQGYMLKAVGCQRMKERGDERSRRGEAEG